MSKKDQLENLATFIGLRAAHEVMIKFTIKPESIPHLNKEADTYSELSMELAEGNWNKEDLMGIKEISEKICNKKISKYSDIGDEKYKAVESIIDTIMTDLGLV